jgi:hypothetical protein
VTHALRCAMTDCSPNTDASLNVRYVIRFVKKKRLLGKTGDSQRNGKEGLGHGQDGQEIFKCVLCARSRIFRPHVCVCSQPGCAHVYMMLFVFMLFCCSPDDRPFEGDEGGRRGHKETGVAHVTSSMPENNNRLPVGARRAIGVLRGRQLCRGTRCTE